MKCDPGLEQENSTFYFKTLESKQPSIQSVKSFSTDSEVFLNSYCPFHNITFRLQEGYQLDSGMKALFIPAVNKVTGS